MHFYRSFGLVRSSATQLLGLMNWIRGFQAAVIKGNSTETPSPDLGDGFQMPGVFVLHKGEVVRSFLSIKILTIALTTKRFARYRLSLPKHCLHGIQRRLCPLLPHLQQPLSKLPLSGCQGSRHAPCTLWTTVCRRNKTREKPGTNHSVLFGMNTKRPRRMSGQKSCSILFSMSNARSCFSILWKTPCSQKPMK